MTRRIAAATVKGMKFLPLLGEWLRSPFCFVLFLVIVLMGGPAIAQTPSSSLHGQVVDQTGAVIPQATVTVTSSTGEKSSATTDNVGNYNIKGLSSGQYSVEAAANGFSTFTGQTVSVAGGEAKLLNIPLSIQVEQEKIDVQEQGNTVDVSPDNNASSLILKGKDLEALSDDPDELQTELQALAGPSAGPNGGQIYIDGFTGGQLPPKASIREIRVNQNPFSAEYDKVGYGRIEIFTKPGTDKFHGQFQVTGNDSAFNAPWNPFHTTQPGYASELYSGNVSGPLGKKASFFINVERRNIDQNALINATVVGPGPDFAPTRFSQAISTPRIRTNITPRVDIQLTQNNTLTARYEFEQNNQNNQGVGQFSLASQAYNDDETEHTLQISDTQILSANVVNETRFQYIRDRESNTPQNSGVTTSVLGAFNGGGSPQGRALDVQNHFELQNYTSIVHGKHFIKFGARLRAVTDSNTSATNFNGTFTFPSIQAYQVTLQGMTASCLAALQILKPHNAVPASLRLPPGSHRPRCQWWMLAPMRRMIGESVLT